MNRPHLGDPNEWRDVHPAWLDADELLRECTIVQTRRGGPGGQHRNKVSTAIVLTHNPSGVTAEATERRSQLDNRRVATRRLREQLAISIRCARDVHATHHEFVDQMRQKYDGGQPRLAETNVDRPAVLALLLDDIHHASNQVSAVADQWSTTTSQVIRFLKQIPEAFLIVNAWRAAAGQKPLK